MEIKLNKNDIEEIHYMLLEVEQSFGIKFADGEVALKMYEWIRIVVLGIEIVFELGVDVSKT